MGLVNLNCQVLPCRCALGRLEAVAVQLRWEQARSTGPSLPHRHV